MPPKHGPELRPVGAHRQEVSYPSSVKEAVPVVVSVLFVVGLIYIRQRWGDDPDKRAENRHLADGEKLHDVERSTGIGRY